jgi:hypothetical protein
MGYIIALALILFAEDCLITVEGVIINSGARQAIRIELSLASNGEEPTQIIVEEVLKRKSVTVLPIVTNDAEHVFGKFHWHGHLADQLRLHFVNAGLPGCPKDVTVALCDLLYSLPCWTENIIMPDRDTSLPTAGLISLLGTAPWHRMQQVWAEILGVTPTLPRKNPKDARREFLRVMNNATAAVPCSCSKCIPDLILQFGTDMLRDYSRDCPTYVLQRGVRTILKGGVMAVFANPGENVVVEPYDTSYDTRYGPTQMFDCENFGELPPKNIVHNFWFMFLDYGDRNLARVDGSCVLYPTELITLKKSSDLRLSFEITDGRLLYNGRYFNTLIGEDTGHRAEAEKSLIYGSNKIIPSSIGEHSALTLSIRERLHALELGATLQGPSHAIRIDLRGIMKWSIGLVRTKACEHSVDCALESEYLSNVLITSVFEPRAAGKKVAIAQVKSNLEAQLLCCEPGTSCLLLSDCCLNCGVKEAIAMREVRRSTPVILIVS